ncbi:MAG: sigma-70 family RNA polymerase sigma factor [Ktedonobacterales bacterium]|nr:sigma-70 family RNA polymerase sigma factor [Ktedonobacterales bacterium]
MTASPPPDDTILLARIASNDDAALRLLYQRYSAVVFSLALRMLRDQTGAEEVTQDTFVRIWRMAHTFDPARGRAEGWVITIARNLTLSRLRKTHENVAETPIETMDLLADEGLNPEEIAWVSARRQMVRAALGQLPEGQRQVVVLAYFEGLTHAEIAARTGDPLGTVKSRLRLALRHLEAILPPDLRQEPHYPPRVTR